MPVIWHGSAISAGMQDELRHRVKLACELVEKVCKHSMKLGGRTESGRREKGKKPGKIGRYRSKPGEVPRVQTGRLRRSITHELEPILPEGRVGTNVKYAPTLELGGPKMAARPFLRPALDRSRRAIEAIFRRPITKLPGVPI